jgi:hypothetical protein
MLQGRQFTDTCQGVTGLPCEVVSKVTAFAAFDVDATLAKVKRSHSVTPFEAVAFDCLAFTGQSLDASNVKSEAVGSIVQVSNTHNKSPLFVAF